MRAPSLLVACVLVAALAPLRAGAGDLSQLDLTGHWYVLIHFKDKKSDDKSLTKFKDSAWSIRSKDGKLEVVEYPHVKFDDGTEEIRRAAMLGHKPWQPEGLVLDALREHVDVSSRALREKTLSGDHKQGFKSGEEMPAAGNAIGFLRNWQISFSPAKATIKIVDSLSSGNAALGVMEEATIFEITERTADGELRGTYAEGQKSGLLRLIRAKERRMLN